MQYYPTKRTFIILAILLLSSAQSLRASSDIDSARKFRYDSIAQTKRLYWLSVGHGLSQVAFVVGSLKATVAIGVESISAKFLTNFPQIGDRYKEFGLYYGRQFYVDVLLGHIAAGVSYFTAAEIQSLALSGEVELLIADDFAGLGISVFGNIAPKYQFIGLSVNLHLGKLE